MKLIKRSMLGAAAALAMAVTAAPATAQTGGMPQATEVPLWPSTPPGGGGARGAERRTDEGAVSNISNPRLEIYHPAQPNGTAVLILGGGGYFRIEIGPEADPTARWLMALGVTPIVVYYRMPGDGWSADAPFQDIERAIRIVRSRAGELGIDPHQIGVLGYSAGGHLAAMAETQFDHAYYQPIDAIDQQSDRPDFAALIYPVITFKPPFDTTRSEREIIGDGRDPAKVSAYSPEDHVTGQTPPTFLAQAADDPISAPDNSLLMFQALRKAKVPAELHMFERGRHGFGLGDPGTLVSAWPRLFTAWAKSHGLMGAAKPASPAGAAADDNDEDE